MANSHNDNRKPSWMVLPLMLLAGFLIVVGFQLAVYRPDRPDRTIVPQSSSGPAFVVQIIRPRLGLPLGGLLPPALFGLDAQLGFDSKSDGASIGSVGPRRIELAADDWDLLIVLDSDGRVTSETQIVFDLVFEEQVRTVRCRPADPAVGTMNTVTLGKSGEMSGSFDIDLAHCEDAETGTPLGWPPKPFVLHGSFDRLTADTETE